MSVTLSVLGRVAEAMWLHLGYWLEHKGMSSISETCFRNGAAGKGQNAGEAGFQLSQKLLARNRNTDAVRVCEEALKRTPNHPRLWCALGAAQRRLAHMAAACEAYEKAIALDSSYAEAWCNLGEWWLVKGNFATALEHFERALAADPRLLEALNNRAAALYELARFKEAEDAARCAIEIYPDQAALHVNLGNVLLHSGKARLSLKAFRRALECDPACPEAHLSLATVLGETHHLAETLAWLEHQIAIKGESAQRLASLALAQQAKGDVLAAEVTCNKVLEMQPTNISALVTLAGCRSAQGDHLGSIHLHEKALNENPDMPGACSNIAFHSTYLPDMSVETVYAYHRLWAERFEEKADSPPSSYPNLKQPDRPLRIGYVSGDFGRHPVGFLLRDVIRHHDGKQFYIHCYSMMRGSDDITAAIREGADAWIESLLLSDDELAEQIRNDRIDILVDLSGHTAYNRLPVFVRHPAPVQASWIGYFHSTGLDRIDYFITDPYTSPKGCGQLFSEIPIHLPATRFCYSPPDYAPEVALPPCLARESVTFGSFNRAEKLVDPVLDAWVAILQAVPGSRLLVKAGTLNNETMRERLAERFVARGLNRDRLELRGGSAHPEMLAEYGEVDIALDPFPFNGGMTTLEALWMGVPVVTLAGQGVVSRQTVSALANLGLNELAYSDLASYRQGVVDLAADRDRLTGYRQKLRPLMAASPLCQPERFARELETMYRLMWQAWCRGEKLSSDV